MGFLRPFAKIVTGPETGATVGLANRSATILNAIFIGLLGSEHVRLFRPNRPDRPDRPFYRPFNRALATGGVPVASQSA